MSAPGRSGQQMNPRCQFGDGRENVLIELLFIVAVRFTDAAQQYPMGGQHLVYALNSRQVGRGRRARRQAAPLPKELAGPVQQVHEGAY
ncbi:hypothetical protein BURC_03417 [Burkholderiaceae bacterium]|nr:hypothetical protein BURC_03417 [Burkholderiaceae bacterium]